MQSAVFATSPEAAGDLVAAIVAMPDRGKLQYRSSEVMDIDEEALRRGAISPRLFGYATVPYIPLLLQNAKVRNHGLDEAALEAAARHLAAGHGHGDALCDRPRPFHQAHPRSLEPVRLPARHRPRARPAAGGARRQRADHSRSRARPAAEDHRRRDRRPGPRVRARQSGAVARRHPRSPAATRSPSSPASRSCWRSRTGACWSTPAISRSIANSPAIGVSWSVRRRTW